MKEWKGYKKGINLGGWLSQCPHTKEHYRSFITKNDFDEFSTWGIDHVRVPVDYNLVEDAEGNYIEYGFEKIQRTIDWCEAYKLNMILDLHKTFGFSFDIGENECGFFENEEYQERFYRLWETFARKFGNNGDRVAFELLNEVTDPKYSDKWNEIVEKTIARIRVYAPDVVILVGGYWNNNVASVKDLLPPADDRIVYNFHCYDPLIFTHQGAYWTAGMPVDFRLPFGARLSTYRENAEKFVPGTARCLDGEDGYLTEEYFEKLFAEAIEVAKERGTILYCGEYGVIELTHPYDAYSWYRTIHNVFEKYGIGRAVWSYKRMDFGIADEHYDRIREDLLKCL